MAEIIRPKFMIRMSEDVARFLDASPAPRGPLTGLPQINTEREIFVWTTAGGMWRWPFISPHAIDPTARRVGL